MSNILSRTIQIPEFARYEDDRPPSFPLPAGMSFTMANLREPFPCGRLSFPDWNARKNGSQPTLHLDEKMAANHMEIFGYVGHINQLARADFIAGFSTFLHIWENAL